MYKQQMRERKMKEDELYMMFKAEMEESEERTPQDGTGGGTPGGQEASGEFCNAIVSTKK